jgi:sarcosine oxidase gamma subunit
MDDTREVGAGLEAAAGLEADGISVRLESGLLIASLRYFEAAGEFAAALGSDLGGAMPEPLRAVLRPMGGAGTTAGDSELVLAWRSPSETILLSRDAEQFASIAKRAAGRSDGCMVDQTDGISAYTVTGTRAPDLLARLGSAAATPALGEAHASRLAELAVMSLCVRPGDITLLVERVYAGHLMGWIAATVADF